mgnify:CR=1 FL=1
MRKASSCFLVQLEFILLLLARFGRIGSHRVLELGGATARRNGLDGEFSAYHGVGVCC